MTLVYSFLWLSSTLLLVIFTSTGLSSHMLMDPGMFPGFETVNKAATNVPVQVSLLEVDC